MRKKHRRAALEGALIGLVGGTVASCAYGASLRETAGWAFVGALILAIVFMQGATED